MGVGCQKIFIYIAIRISKIQLSASDPEKSKIRVLRFRRAWSAFTVGNAILMNLMLIAPQMQVLQFNLPNTFIWIISVLVVCIILGWVLYLSIRLGQGGSRIKLSGSGMNGEKMNRDDDKFWKWGSFYYNPEDPSLMVEKRFGIGWTMNFGNKWAWVIMSLLILIITAVIILSPS